MRLIQFKIRTPPLGICISLLFRVEDLYQEDVDLVPGQQRPDEYRHEAVVQRHPDAGARSGMRRQPLPAAKDQDQLHQEEVGAEVGVDADAVGTVVATVT